MRLNTVDYLYDLIKLAHPNAVDAVFTETLDSILCAYMNKFYLLSDKKQPKIWRHFNFVKKNPTNLPTDLFYQKKYRKNIFSKSENIIVQKKDTKDTIQELLNSGNEIILQNFNEVCQKIKQKIKISAKGKLQEKQTEQKKKNKFVRGEYYLKYSNNIHEQNLINPKKICLVHATKFYPKKNPNGEYVIETTAHATKYLLARPTVHFTCNHIVESHLYGDWSNMPYVIMAPLRDIVELNGNPRRFSAIDTYFLPEPDVGIIMPKTIMIVEPSDNLPNEKLFQITSNNHCYYRNSNFSTEMVQKLTKSRFCNQYLLKQKNKHEYLCELSRDMAAAELMEQNGFDYLHSIRGSVMSDNKIMDDYAFTGHNMGMESISTQYVHMSDTEANLNYSYDSYPGYIYLAEKGKKIPDWAVDNVKKWIEEYIVGDKSIQKMNVSETDLPQIKKTKIRYNIAVEKLKNKLKKEIKTKSDVLEYIKKVGISNNSI